MRAALTLVALLLVAGLTWTPATGEDHVLEWPVPVRHEVDWLANGTFHNSGIKGVHADLEGWEIPPGTVTPLLEALSPTVTSFHDEFDNQNGGNPGGWNCGNNGIDEVNGYARAGGNWGAEVVAWCNAAFPEVPLENQDVVTFQFRTWVRDYYVHDYAGVKMKTVLDHRLNYFNILENETGHIYAFSNYQDEDGAVVPVTCAPSATLLPEATNTTVWHDYRVVVDAANERFHLLQDGILRCSLDYLPRPRHEQEHAVEIGIRSSNSDPAWVHHDKVAVAGGQHDFTSSAIWTSPPLEKHDQFEWGSVQLDWAIWGIGNISSDVAEKIRVDVLDANTGLAFPGLENLVVTSYLDLSGLHHSEKVQLRVRWLDVLSDLVGLEAITLHSGPLRPFDLSVGPISAEPRFQDIWSDDPGIEFASRISWDRADSPTADVRWKLDGRLVHDNTQRVFEELENGEEIVHMHDLPLGAGWHEIEVEVSVEDEDPANNSWWQRFRVHPASGPVLTVHDPMPDLGEAVEILVQPTVAGMAIDVLNVDWGDGTTERLSGVTGLPGLSHTYAAAGTWEVRAWAELADGFISREANVSGRIGNLVPTAAIDHSQPWPNLPDVHLFSCANSTDTPGDILTCVWSFDGRAPVHGDEVVHVFENAGEHHVLLEVSDQTGGLGSAELNLTVELARTGRLLHGVVVEDVESVPEGGEIRIRPVLNESTSLQGLTYAYQEGGLLLEVIPDGGGWLHIPAGTSAGTVQSALFLQADGGFDMASFAFEVHENAPVLPVFEEVVLWEDEIWVLDWSAARDDPWDGLWLEVGFDLEGRGEILTADPLDRTVAMRFAEAGDHAISLRLTDGTLNDTGLVRLEVVNQPPAAEPWCRLEAGDLHCAANASDTPSDLDHLTYRWNIEGIWVEGGEAHAWASPPPGDHLIRVEVTDDDGAAVERTVLHSIAHPDAEQGGGVLDLTQSWVGPVFTLLSLVLLMLIGIVATRRIRRSAVRPGGPEWWADNPWELTQRVEAEDHSSSAAAAEEKS